MNKFVFGQNFYKLRKQNKLSQKDVSTRLNVTVSAVSKWENGKNLPDIDMLRSISDLFRVPMETLLNNRLMSDDMMNEAFEAYEEELAELVRLSEANMTMGTPLNYEETLPEATRILKRKNKVLSRTLILVSIFLCVVVVAFSFVAYSSKASGPFTIVNSRSVENSTWGPTTELAVVYKGELEYSLIKDYSSTIREEWINEGKHGGPFVANITVYIYSDKAAAKTFSKQYESYFIVFSQE